MRNKLTIMFLGEIFLHLSSDKKRRTEKYIMGTYDLKRIDAQIIECISSLPFHVQESILIAIRKGNINYSVRWIVLINYMICADNPNPIEFLSMLEKRK